MGGPVPVFSRGGTTEERHDYAGPPRSPIEPARSAGASVSPQLSPPALLSLSFLHHCPHSLCTRSTMTTRPRAMSGTIPSMESSHDELKDNTIIIGAILFDCARARSGLD